MGTNFYDEKHFPKGSFSTYLSYFLQKQTEMKMKCICETQISVEFFFSDLFWSMVSGWNNLLSQHNFEQYFGMNKIIVCKPVCYHIQNAFNVHFYLTLQFKRYYLFLYIFILHCNLKDRSSFCLTQTGNVYYPELCKFQLFFGDISVTLL